MIALVLLLCVVVGAVFGFYAGRWFATLPLRKQPGHTLALVMRNLHVKEIGVCDVEGRLVKVRTEDIALRFELADETVKNWRELFEDGR